MFHEQVLIKSSVVGEILLQLPLYISTKSYPRRLQSSTSHLNTMSDDFEPVTFPPADDSVETISIAVEDMDVNETIVDDVMTPDETREFEVSLQEEEGAAGLDSGPADNFLPAAKGGNFLQKLKGLTGLVDKALKFPFTPGITPPSELGPIGKEIDLDAKSGIPKIPEFRKVGKIANKTAAVLKYVMEVSSDISVAQRASLT